MNKPSLRLFSLASQSDFGGWPLLHAQLESISRLTDQDIHKELLSSLVKKFVALEQLVDELLKNTLPPMVAEEIKYLGAFAPRTYDCTILFSDIANFTRLTEQLSSEELIEILDAIFSSFDRIVRNCQGTKIKTSGDAYMAVFGAPIAYEGHAPQAVRAATQMLAALSDFNRTWFDLAEDRYFQCRIGIHSGTVIAGVVGEDRMQFDIFGDTVNIASRFESSGEVGRINISEETRRRLPPSVLCEDRGEVPLKNKRAMKAYFVATEQQEEPKDGENGTRTQI